MNARKRQLWVWSGQAGEPGKAFLTEIGGLKDDTAQRLLNGDPLDPPPRLTGRQYKPGTFGDMLGDAIGLLVLAPPLLEVVRAAGARLQVIPLTIARRPRLGYAVVNVLERVAAIDLAHSSFTTFAGTDLIDRVTQLAPRAVADDAPAIFHAAEHPVLILVNDGLRRQLQAASPDPGVLTPLEEWRNVF